MMFRNEAGTYAGQEEAENVSRCSEQYGSSCVNENKSGGTKEAENGFPTTLWEVRSRPIYVGLAQHCRRSETSRARQRCGVNTEPRSATWHLLGGRVVPYFCQIFSLLSWPCFLKPPLTEQ